MTRLLVWNINNFTVKRIDDPKTPQTTANSQDCYDHIFNHVLLATAPDLFVILEVGARTDAMRTQGAVMSNNGAAAGLIMLLRRLKALPAPGNQWALVPPIANGVQRRSEGVAVFYNTARLEFIGPYVYGLPPQSDRRGQPVRNPEETAFALPAPPLLPATLPYPAPWANCLPPLPRRVQVGPAAGIPPAQGIPENQMAGQAFFPGHLFPGNDNRAPFLTVFNDTVNNRTISLYSVHTSPPTAVAAMAEIGQLAFAAPVAGRNNINVVAGDFNADPFDTSPATGYGGVPTNQAAYNPLLGRGFTLLLSSTNPPGGVTPEVAARMPYCGTHLLTLDLATPCALVPGAVPPSAGPYPRFGYLGESAQSVLAGAIDNVLVNPLTPPNPPLLPIGAYAAVVNTVIGMPYDQLPAAQVPAGVTQELMTGPTLPSRLQMAVPVPAGVPLADLVARRDFRTWPNFEKIRTTSDHLAVFAEF